MSWFVRNLYGARISIAGCLLSDQTNLNYDYDWLSHVPQPLLDAYHNLLSHLEGLVY